MVLVPLGIYKLMIILELESATRLKATLGMLYDTSVVIYEAWQQYLSRRSRNIPLCFGDDSKSDEIIQIVSPFGGHARCNV